MHLQEDADEHEQLRVTLATDAVDWSDLQTAESLLNQLRAMWQTLWDLNSHMPDWTTSALLDPSTGKASCRPRSAIILRFEWSYQRKHVLAAAGRMADCIDAPSTVHLH